MILGNFFEPWTYLCTRFRKIGSMNFYNFYRAGYLASWSSYRFIRIISSLALFVAIFVFSVNYGSYWVNFKTMLYGVGSTDCRTSERLSNLGLTSDTEHIFLNILSDFIYLAPCPLRWHPRWWRSLEKKCWWQFEDFGDRRFDTSKNTVTKSRQ